MVVLKPFFVLEPAMKPIQNYLWLMEGYARYGFRPLLELLWSLSVLFGLMRLIEWLMTERPEVFGFGLAFLAGGLLLVLALRSLDLLSSWQRKGV